MVPDDVDHGGAVLARVVQVGVAVPHPRRLDAMRVRRASVLHRVMSLLPPDPAGLMVFTKVVKTKS